MDYFLGFLIVTGLFVIFPIYIISKISNISDKLEALERKYANLKGDLIKLERRFNERTVNTQTESPSYSAKEINNTEQASKHIKIEIPEIKPAPIIDPIIISEEVNEKVDFDEVANLNELTEEFNPFIHKIEEEETIVEPILESVQPKEEIVQTPVIKEIKEPEIAGERRYTYRRPVEKESKGVLEWEALIGGKFLNRIGAVAIIIAMGFFLKYAFDNNLINEYMRVGIGILAGAGLVAGGMYSHKKDLKIFSQGLLGAGVAVLFTSVFAAFNFYHLLPQIPAIIAMCCVTALSIALGLKYESQAMIFIGWFGAFATPFLISTGQANDYGLWGYIFGVNIVFLALSFLRDKQRILYPFTTIATLFVLLFWMNKLYTNEKIIFLIVMTSIFWVLYLAFEYYFSMKEKPGAQIILTTHFINSAVLFTVNFSSIYNVWNKFGSSIFSAIVAIIYLGIFYTLYNRAQFKVIVQYFIYFAALILTSVLLGFSQKFNIIIISGLGLAGMYFSVVKKLNFVKYTSIFYIVCSLFCLLIFKEVYVLNYLPEYMPILNFRGYIFLIVFACVYISGIIVYKTELPEILKKYSEFAYSICAILLFTYFTCEGADWLNKLFANNAVFRTEKIITILSPMWMTLSFLILAFGFKKDSISLINMSFFSTALAYVLPLIIYTAFDLTENPIILINYRFIVFAANSILLLGIIIYLEKIIKEKNTNPGIIKLFELFISLAGMFTLTVELVDYLGKIYQYVYQYPVLILTVFWSVYALLNILISYSRKSRFLFNSGIIFSVSAFLIMFFQFVFFNTGNDYYAFLNLRFAIFLITTALFVLNVYVINNNKTFELNFDFIQILDYVEVAIAGILLICLSMELYLSLDGLFNYMTVGRSYKIWSYICLMWQALAVIEFYYGIKRENKILTYKAILLSALTLVIALIINSVYNPFNEFTVILNYRFVNFTAFIALFGLLVYLINKNKDMLPAGEQIVKNSMTIIILSFLYLATVEVNDYFIKIGGSGITGQDLIDNDNKRQLFLSGIWIVYSIICIITGFVKRNFKVRIIGISVISISTLKVFIYDLNFLNSLNRIFSFIILGVILIAASFMYQKFKGALLKD